MDGNSMAFSLRRYKFYGSSCIILFQLLNLLANKRKLYAQNWSVFFIAIKNRLQALHQIKG